MKNMFRRFVSPSLAKEIELDRPATSLAERAFHVAVAYFCVVGAAMSVMRLFLSSRTMESEGGVVGAVVGILFGFCFFYMLNYLVWRFVKSRVVRVAWWGLMSLIAVLVVASLVMRYGGHG